MPTFKFSFDERNIYITIINFMLDQIQCYLAKIIYLNIKTVNCVSNTPNSLSDIMICFLVQHMKYTHTLRNPNYIHRNKIKFKMQNNNRHTKEVQNGVLPKFCVCPFIN